MSCNIVRDVPFRGINQSVVIAVAEKRSAMKAAEFFAERCSRAGPKAVMVILSSEGDQPLEPEERLQEDLRES